MNSNKEEKDILAIIDTDALHEEDTNVPADTDDNKPDDLTRAGANDKADDEADDSSDEEGDEAEEGDDDQEDVTDIKDEEEESHLAFLVQDFQTQTGLEFTEEELDEIAAMDESLESVSKVALITGKKIARVEREAFYAENPDLYEAFLYKQVNGSLQGFGQGENYPDYSGLDLESEADQKLIYTEYLKMKGTAEDEIADLIESAETKNLLKTRAQAAHQAVNTFFDKKKEERVKSLEIQAEKDRLAGEAIVKQVFDTIDSGKIMGVQLDKKQQQELKEFNGKIIDKEGRTAKDVAYANLTVEQELLIDLFVKNGFKNIAALEKPTANKLQAKKDLLKKRTPPVGDSKKTMDMSGGLGEIDMGAVKEFTSKRQ